MRYGRMCVSDKRSAGMLAFRNDLLFELYMARSAISFSGYKYKRFTMQNATIREMCIEDYDRVHALWMTIRGFAIRSIDDSREGVERFLMRNPHTSVVAEKDGEIVGAILCGHDGRRGCLYHVCVREDLRMHGLGKAMVVFCMEALRKEKINKVSLIAFTRNDIGNAFWKTIGWTKREDLNYYDFTLNEENITKFNA